jgi:hypothetical protein
MKQGLCDIIVVMDRSGSMSTIQKDMEGGFDQFIKDQKALPGECRVSLFQFDDQYEQVYLRRPVAEVPPCRLIPRNMTALLDAVGRTINSVGTDLASIAESERPEKVVFMVITDGQENASHEFTKQQVQGLVECQKTNYNWQFVYLGSDLSTFDDAAGIGVQGVMFSATSVGTRRAYRDTARAVMSYRVGMTSTLQVPSDLTDPEDPKP